MSVVATQAIGEIVAMYVRSLVMPHLIQIGRATRTALEVLDVTSQHNIDSMGDTIAILIRVDRRI